MIAKIKILMIIMILHAMIVVVEMMLMVTSDFFKTFFLCPNFNTVESCGEFLCRYYLHNFKEVLLDPCNFVFSMKVFHLKNITFYNRRTLTMNKINDSIR